MIDYTLLPSREIERLARNIRPGEWAWETARPIATLLGSCVGVCLFDTGLPIGGMNHFMLPQMGGGQNAKEDILLAGDACMEALLNALLARGAARHRIKAKAFGGGTIIETSGQSLAIGQRNAEFTRDWLEREGIPLVASDFLGPWSRKVLLVPQNGDVYCKRIVTSMVSADALRREERAYAESFSQTRSTATGNKIELF